MKTKDVFVWLTENGNCKHILDMQDILTIVTNFQTLKISARTGFLL